MEKSTITEQEIEEGISDITEEWGNSETQGNDTRNPERRGRGRPKLTEEEKAERKAQREAKANGKTDEFSFVSEKNVKRGRPAKHKPVFMTLEEANKHTDFIIETIEGFAKDLIGEEAQFTASEKLVLYYSLPKYLSSIDIGSVQKIGNTAAPLAILAVAILFAFRCFIIWRKKYDAEHPKEINGELNTQSTEPYNPKVDTLKEQMNHEAGKEDWSKPDILWQNAQNY